MSDKCIYFLDANSLNASTDASTDKESPTGELLKGIAPISFHAMNLDIIF